MSNPRLPRPPSRLESILTWATEVQAYLRSLTPFISPTVRPNHRWNGTTYDSSAPAPNVAAVTTPWQAYLSPWQGPGTDPNASTRAARFRLQRGKFAGSTPSNMSTEFLAFGDITDTGIEEDDAVYTQVYLTVAVSESSLGSGDVTYGTPEIDTVEGDDLVAALGDSIPNFGDDGSLPSAIIVPICEVQMYGGAIYFPPGTSTYLDAVLSVTGGSDCEHQMRDFSIVTS